jgi:hypothetical protein
MSLNEKIQVLFQLHEEEVLTSDQVVETIKRWLEDGNSVLNEPSISPPIYHDFPEDSSKGDPTPPFVTECERGGWTLTFGGPTTFGDHTNCTTEEKKSIAFDTVIFPENKEYITSIDPVNPDTIYIFEITKD